MAMTLVKRPTHLEALRTKPTSLDLDDMHANANTLNSIIRRKKEGCGIEFHVDNGIASGGIPAPGFADGDYCIYYKKARRSKTFICIMNEKTGKSVTAIMGRRISRSRPNQKMVLPLDTTQSELLIHPMVHGALWSDHKVFCTYDEVREFEKEAYNSLAV